MPGPSYEWDLLLSAFPSPPVLPADGRAAPVGRDIAFDPVTGHFVLAANGDMTLRTGLDAIKQMVDITLKTLLGEWFVNTTVGVPYFQEILVKAPNIAAINQIFKQAIEAVDGIGSVTGLTSNFDRAARTLNISWTASTNLGAPLSGSVAQPVGA
jgi:hypothetical protein